MTDSRKYMQSPEDFIAALERRAHTRSLISIDDPLAEARHVIIDDYAWPSGGVMWDLLRTLAGSQEEFFEGVEEVFDQWELSVAAALVAAKRIGMYSDEEWSRVTAQVEDLVVELDEIAWYAGDELRKSM